MNDYIILHTKNKYIIPIDQSSIIRTITEYYTHDIQWMNGEKYDYRQSIDFLCHNDTDVVASSDGTVVKVFLGVDDVWDHEYLPDEEEYPRRKWFGNYIIIRHDNNEFSMYGHLHHIRVDFNERVKRGQKIGTSGYNGISRVPHIHFMVFIFTRHSEDEHDDSIKTLKINFIE